MCLRRQRLLKIIPLSYFKTCLKSALLGYHSVFWEQSGIIAWRGPASHSGWFQVGYSCEDWPLEDHVIVISVPSTWCCVFSKAVWPSLSLGVAGAVNHKGPQLPLTLFLVALHLRLTLTFSLRGRTGLGSGDPSHSEVCEATSSSVPTPVQWDKCFTTWLSSSPLLNLSGLPPKITLFWQRKGKAYYEHPTV